MALAFNINTGYAIWQTAVACIAIVIAIRAGIQYRKNKTTVALHLFVAFIVTVIAAIMQCTPTIYNLFFSSAPQVGIPWVDSYVILPWHGYQFAYYFLMGAVYFFFLFSLDLIFEEGTKKLVKIAPVVVLFTIAIYGMFLKQFITIESEFITIISGIDIWSGIFIIVLMIPLIVDSARVLRKLEGGDSMRMRFTYIIIFTSCLLVMIISFVVESFVGPSPNAFSFIAWVFAVAALFFAYAGLYRKK